jgi:hypothetical protein
MRNDPTRLRVTAVTSKSYAGLRPVRLHDFALVWQTVASGGFGRCGRDELRLSVAGGLVLVHGASVIRRSARRPGAENARLAAGTRFKHLAWQ